GKDGPRPHVWLGGQGGCWGSGRRCGVQESPPGRREVGGRHPPSEPRAPVEPSGTGTDRHELTSWKSFPSIFKFFTEASEAKTSSLKPALTRRSHRIKHEEL
uniref:Uncharacterized protein n=1 Tax=Sus scrofa TaxID=9823 RepID=A0A8D0PD77_PIG